MTDKELELLKVFTEDLYQNGHISLTYYDSMFKLLEDEQQRRVLIQDDVIVWGEAQYKAFNKMRVPSEDVQRAIDDLSKAEYSFADFNGGNNGPAFPNVVKNTTRKLAITALRQYQPKPTDENIQRAIEYFEQVLFDTTMSINYAYHLNLAITALQQMQGWIPVTDENNPYPYDEEVLCLQEGGSVFSAYCELDSGHWFRGYDKMADPTHWMPLPPKGE